MRRIISSWWTRLTKKAPVEKSGDKLYTYAEAWEIAQEYGDIRYNDGKRDGLAIAREQATKSLKEILWQQNQHQQKKQ